LQAPDNVQGTRKQQTPRKQKKITGGDIKTKETDANEMEGQKANTKSPPKETRRGGTKTQDANSN